MKCTVSVVDEAAKPPVRAGKGIKVTSCEVEERSTIGRLVGVMLACTLALLGPALPAAKAVDDPDVSILIGSPRLDAPSGVALDASGKLYIVDAGNNRVRVLSSSGTTLRTFGSPGSGDGQFNSPWGVAVDSSGNIYVSDSGNNRVQKFDPAGTYLSQFGGLGSGNGQLNEPRGIALDGANNIYVADRQNHRVQKFNSSGGYLAQFGSSGSGDGQFRFPRAIAVDASGNVYVADSDNKRVQKFNSAGVYQSQFGGSGSGDGQFNLSWGIAVDGSGNIYVSDVNLQRVQKFNSAGVYQAQFGGSGSGPGQLSNPLGLATDGAGNVYVADSLNKRVQKFNSAGTYLTQFGAPASGDGQLSVPKGVGLDGAGNIYVADTGNSRVQKFGPAGAYLSQFGGVGSGDGQFNSPRGIRLDVAGNIYVADTGNARVQRFDLAGNYQSQFGSSGSGTGQLAIPEGLAIDGAGNVFVAEVGNHRVQKFNSAGLPQAQLGAEGSGNAQMFFPQGVAVDGSGNVYVADTGNRRVEKFDSAGVFERAWGEDVASAGPGNTGDGFEICVAANGDTCQSGVVVGAPADGDLDLPAGIVTDTAGNVYVADVGNHRVQKFSPAGAYLDQWQDDDLFEPEGLALTPSGDLLVTSSPGQVLRIALVVVAPTVTTDPATNVTSTGASLNVTINPGGAATTYRYEYGPTTAFGTVVPASGTLNAGSGSTSVSQPAQAISGLSAGTTYYFRACATNSVTGAGAANQVCGNVRAFTTTGTTAPSASTSAATAIANTTAQLNGSVNAHGAATVYVFEYGTSTAFGQIAPIPSGNAGPGTATQTVNTPLSGLQPRTTYLYRLVAVNAQGTTTGAVQSFTTTGPAVAPSVTTSAASNITQTGALLNGTVNPHGQATTFTFEYGTTTSFGHITSVDNAGNHSSTVPVSLPASGLTANTTYLYRMVATNATGTTVGTVMSFKTAP